MISGYISKFARLSETVQRILERRPALARIDPEALLSHSLLITHFDPKSPVAEAYLIRERPDLLYLSGPPTYLEAQIGSALIERGIESLRRIIDATGCRVILDHHALRDRSYRERLGRVWETGRVQTAAGFLGAPDALLDALASRSGGVSQYIASTGEIQHFLRERLQGLSAVYGDNMRLTLKGVDGVRIKNAFKLSPYIQRIEMDGPTLVLGPLQSDAPISGMLELIEFHVRPEYWTPGW